MNSKPDNITLLREFLITQMNHWMLFPIYTVFAAMCDNTFGRNISPSSRILLWLVFGLIPFLLYLGRILFKKFWGLGFLSVAIIFLMYMIPTSHVAMQVLHIGVGLGYVINSIYLRMQTTHKNNSKIPPSAGVVISAVCLFVLFYQGHTGWTSSFITILIASLGLYFIAYYIEQYQNFLSANAGSAGYIAEKEFFRSGASLVIGYTGIGLLIMFLVSNTTWLSVILQVIKNILIFILRLLFSLIPKDTQTEELPSSPTAVEMPGYMEQMEAAETSPIWVFLEKVAIVLTVAAVVFLLVKIMIFLVKFIQKMLINFEPEILKHSGAEDVFDVREKCAIDKDSDWQMPLPFLIRNPKKRIRQLYKKRILSSRTAFSQDHKDASYLNLFTARESSRILNRDELARIYEKARYSNEDCDTEDVKQMKNACR